MNTLVVILSEAGAGLRRAAAESKDPYGHRKLSRAVILSEGGLPSGFFSEGNPSRRT